MTPEKYATQEKTTPCECGCGTLLPPYNLNGSPSRFVHGHQFRGKHHTKKSKRLLSKNIRAHYDRIGRAGATWERWKDPRYAAWRRAVFERDNYTCQQCGWVGTENEKGFAAHHLKGYADYPDLRYDVDNGLTLCKQCHMALHGIAAKPRQQVPCACGCGTLIWNVGREGKERRYVNGHWSRGIAKTDEQKRKISAAKKGKKMSPELRAKWSAVRKGKPLSDAFLKGAAEATERRRGQKDPDTATRNRERVWTDDAKQKISKANTGRKRTPEQRERLSDAHKGKKRSAEHRAKLAENLKKARAAQAAKRTNT